MPTQIGDTLKAHPLAGLFPLIEGQHFDELVTDIRSHGLREPIWLYQGQILDGRNRYRACIEASVTPQVREYIGDDPLGFVLSLNLHRRHLTDGQKAVLALDILPHLEEQARERQAHGSTAPGRSLVERIPQAILPRSTLPPLTDDEKVAVDKLKRVEKEGKSRDEAASRVGVNPRYVSDTKRLNREAPHLIEKLRDGSLTVPAAMRQLKEDERRVSLARPVTIALEPGVHRGDFRELTAQIADESVELVFTDPPYDGESAHLYEDAARIAARILKPGGSFIAYSGQRHLPTVLAGCSRHLTYWWTIAGVHSGGNQLLQKLGIRCGWKPLVWFVKGTRGDVQNILVDVVTGDREKDAHQWQQAESEAMYYIEHLTSPTGLVVDFFLGGGTTAVAAKKLGRPWIGFEVDATAAETASTRIGKAA